MQATAPNIERPGLLEKKFNRAGLCFFYNNFSPFALILFLCYKNKIVKYFEKNKISEPEKWLINAAASIGLDFSGYIHEVTNEFHDHSLKRHGNPNKHGTATITSADFERIPDMVKNPDYAIIGAIRKKTLLNAYAKVDDGATYLYFEEILASRRNRSLRGKTLYKVTRPLSFDEILKNISRNGKTDISKAWIFNSKKNVQTAGGYPGG